MNSSRNFKLVCGLFFLIIPTFFIVLTNLEQCQAMEDSDYHNHYQDRRSGPPSVSLSSLSLSSGSLSHSAGSGNEGRGSSRNSRRSERRRLAPGANPRMVNPIFAGAGQQADEVDIPDPHYQYGFEEKHQRKWVHDMGNNTPRSRMGQHNDGADESEEEVEMGVGNGFAFDRWEWQAQDEDNEDPHSKFGEEHEVGIGKPANIKYQRHVSN